MDNKRIVRQVDDLGRVAIPLSIQKMLKIDAGDEVSIYTDKNNVILKKIGSTRNDPSRW